MKAKAKDAVAIIVQHLHQWGKDSKKVGEVYA